MILLEGYIDRGFDREDADANDPLHDEREEQRTLRLVSAPPYEDQPTRSELEAAEHDRPLPHCGEGDCWHVLNSRLCPPDPWGDQEVQA